MANVDIVQLLLDSVEGQLFECKRAAAAPGKVLESIVAMANAEGGWVAIGLEDPSKASGRSRLIGVSESQDNVSELMNQIAKEITPPLHQIKDYDLAMTNIHGTSDHLKLFVIERSTDIHSLRRGDTLLRKGTHNRKLRSLVKIT